MFHEPGTSELIMIACINMLMTGGMSISHHSAYFMLGVTFWSIHFAHYFFLFTTLTISSLFKYTELKMLPLKEILPVCLSQFVVSTSTCLIHDNGSNGALFAQRLTDGLMIIGVYLLFSYFIPANFGISQQNKYLLICYGISSSLGWFDEIINFHYSYLILLPILDIATVFHFLITLQKFHKLDVPINTFMLNVSGLTSLFLLPAAVWFKSDNVTKEWYNISSALEASDIGVFVMSYGVYTVGMYTKYWLMCKCSQETFLFVRQTKYHIANWGQLFFRNFAYTPISIIARPIGTIFMLLYVRKRLISYKNNKSTSVVQNGV